MSLSTPLKESRECSVQLPATRASKKTASIIPEFKDHGVLINKICDKLQKIMKDKNAHSTVFAFLNPVDEVRDGAEDYYLKVKKPMDLTTILGKRLVSGVYYVESEKIFSELPTKLQSLHTRKEGDGSRCCDKLSSIFQKEGEEKRFFDQFDGGETAPQPALFPKINSGAPVFYGLRRDFFQIRMNCHLYNGPKHELTVAAEILCELMEDSLLGLALDLEPTEQALEDIRLRKMEFLRRQVMVSTKKHEEITNKVKEVEKMDSQRRKRNRDTPEEEDKMLKASNTTKRLSTTALPLKDQVEVKLNLLLSPANHLWQNHALGKTYAEVICPGLVALRRTKELEMTKAAKANTLLDTSPVTPKQLSKLLRLIEHANPSYSLTELDPNPEDVRPKDRQPCRHYLQLRHGDRKPWPTKLLGQVDDWCNVTTSEVLAAGHQ